jgi:hypothetical protein
VSDCSVAISCALGEGGSVFNFAERPRDIDAILPEAACERLLDVKRRWDPDGRIVANHALSLSAA